jgi:hypothetical protein
VKPSVLHVTITCDTGKTWETGFNSFNHGDAFDYFMGKVFTDEDDNTGEETRHRVVRVGVSAIK